MDRVNFEIKQDFDELYATSNNAVEMDFDKNKSCSTCRNLKCVCSTVDKMDEGRNGEKGEETNHDAIEIFKKIAIGCRLCHKKIFKPMYYERHWESNHRGIHPSEMYDNPHQCKICQRYLQNKQSLQSHISAAHNKRKTMASHNLQAGPEESHQRFCPLCGLIVNDYSELKHHLEKIHGGLRIKNKIQEPPNRLGSSIPSQQSPLPNIPSQQSPTVATTPSRKSFVCSTCGIACSDEKSLISHVLSFVCTMKNNAIQTAPEENSLWKMLKPIQVRNPNYDSEVVRILEPYVMYPLVKCDMTEVQDLPVFACNDGSEESLTSKGKNDLICDPLSNKPNFDVQNRKDNMMEIDSNLSSAEFGDQHTNLLLSNEQPFSSMVNVVEHSEPLIVPNNGEEMMVFEDGFKWFRCAICKFVAYNAASLKKHLVAYHKYKGCPVCDYAAQTGSLVEHLKIVHSYQSNSLENDVGEATQDNVHSLTSMNQQNETNSHANPKQRRSLPVVCRVCGVKYSCVRDYRAHFLNYHSEHNPDDMFDNGWKCNQCFKVFQNLIGLRSHWVNQHKETYSKEMFINFAKQAIDDTRSSLASCNSTENGAGQYDSRGKNVSTSVCTICNVPCVDQEQLLLHRSLVHGSMGYDNSGESMNSSCLDATNCITISE